MAKSTTSPGNRKPTKEKPEKPKGFPLFAHGSGQWARKIRGGLRYFGVWADPAAALARHNREWPYLIKGETPPPVDVSGGCTLRTLANAFMNAKRAKLDDGELSIRTFRDYFTTCELVIGQFGPERIVSDLRPDDFRSFRSKLAKRLGVVSLKNEINRITILFNFADENGLIERPVRYGDGFDRPSAKVIRKARNEAAPKMLEADEVRKLLKQADGQMAAMILLAMNGGLGNTDVANLRERHIDLKTGWLNYPRIKTEVPRRIPLWPETIKALRSALADRREPADDGSKGLVFLTRLGRPWVRSKAKAKGEVDENGKPLPEDHVHLDAISSEFKKLMKAAKLMGRPYLSFYALRHVFETIAGDSKDQVAVNAIMGHVDTSMAGAYRERVADDRLKAVVNVVRSWLFPMKAKNAGAA